ncbi:MAG: DUF6279 family lipoprotein [Burkholderiales bacterium]
MTRGAVRAVLLTIAVLLGACTALRFTYSQGTTLTYWWFDSYADFNAEQKPRVQAAIERWFTWHRRTQLPDYTALLERASHEVLAVATPRQACDWWDTLMLRRDAAVMQMAPTLAEIAPSLSPEQLQHIDRKFERNTEKWRDEHLQPDLGKREREAVKRAVDQAEKLYGRLDRAQRELLAEAVRSSPADPEKTLAQREARHRDSLKTLQALTQPGLDRPQAERLTRAWLTRLFTPTDDAARHHQEKSQAHWCAASATLHNRTDAAQRRHAAEALQGWKDDLAGFILPLAGP